MDAFASKLTHIFISWTNKDFSEDDIEVYEYGFQCLLNSAATDLILTLWGFITHSLLETMCWLAIFCIYRHHAGGTHASTSSRCILASSLLGISNIIPLHYANDIKPHLWIGYIFIFINTLLFAPRNSTKKALSSTQKIFQKFFSLCLVVLCLVISTIVYSQIAISLWYGLFTASLLLFSSNKQRNKT